MWSRLSQFPCRTWSRGLAEYIYSLTGATVHSQTEFSTVQGCPGSSSFFPPSSPLGVTSSDALIALLFLLAWLCHGWFGDLSVCVVGGCAILLCLCYMNIWNSSRVYHYQCRTILEFQYCLHFLISNVDEIYRVSVGPESRWRQEPNLLRNTYK